MDAERKVVCINDFYARENLTKGKVYTVTGEDSNWFRVNGESGWWDKTRFKPYVEEYQGGQTLDTEPKDPHEGIVTNPPHYTRWAIEPIEFLYRNRVEGHIFNIVKYSMRAGHKLYPGMDAVQSEIVDLKKAARNIEMRINLLEGKEVL
jgi:hypothetical protein